MIKTITTTEEVKRERRYCDICEKEITSRYGTNQCKICKKDLGNKHIGHETDEDHPDVWCTRCWGIGNEYRLKIAELENKVEVIQKEWEDKCKVA